MGLNSLSLITTNTKTRVLISDDKAQGRASIWKLKQMNLIVETIEQQQTTAAKVVELLEKQFGNATVAGGAPRDWFMGKVARDIDVYVTVEPKKAGILLAMATITLDTEVQQLGKQYEELEQSMISFLTAGTVWYDHTEHNIIFLNKNWMAHTDEVYTHFDCDICQIKWNANDGLSPSSQFLAANENKTIIFNKFEPKHFVKMVDKFRGWNFRFECHVPEIINKPDGYKV